MTHGTRPAPALFLGPQRRAAAAPFCFCAGPQRTLGRLACSAHAVCGPYLPHIPGAATGTHLLCPRIVKEPWRRRQQQQPQPGAKTETLKASHSLSCVLCSQRERLKDLFFFFFLTWNWHLSACFGQAAAALLWAYCKCLHWYLAGVSLQASRKGVGLSPGFRILSEETKGIFRPCRHRVLGGTFPKCGSHLHILSSPPVSSCILVLCPEASD